LLVDCGLFQGSQFAEVANHEPFAYAPGGVEALLVTHAHIDHIGRIPKLVREGFAGPIYSTKETRELAALMLEDSAGVIEKEARREDRAPLYTEADVQATLPLWKTVEYHQPFAVPGGLSACLRDAGHILGSAMVELSAGHTKFVFTGDLGPLNHAVEDGLVGRSSQGLDLAAGILRDAERLTDTTYLVMESVYGDRAHATHEASVGLLEDAIEETIRRGGAVLIPAFSIERTQVLLYHLNELVEHGRIPRVPIFLDSPLAIKATAIYRRATDRFRADVRATIKSGDDIFNFPGLIQTLSSEESRAIAERPNPKIIIAGSGMSNGGRIVYHHKRYLPDPATTVLIVGYQAPGSLGRQLEEGVRKVVIGGESIPVRAKTIALRGFSAHRDSEGLFDFVEQTADTLKQVFVAMGEPKSSLHLAQRLRDYLGVDAVVPEQGSKYELEF
jgi:metallo-beta-lactamase family protein